MAKIEIENPQEKCREMAKLLIEAWDALHAVVKQHHLKLHNISPSLVDRIKTSLEPWEDKS